MAYPLSTLGPTITSTGIEIPTYNDILQSLIALWQSIYGSDIVVDPSSQDGQALAVLANAINDANQAVVTSFQSFSPNYAVGVQLSSLVKLNGLARLVATNSTAVGNVVGVVGSTINGGVVKDVNGKLWDLPATVVIPAAGFIAVSVVAQEAGAIAAGIGDISEIYNPQLGWQSFTNTSVAVAGQAVETDAELRARQAASVAMPALAIKEAIFAAVANISGVGRMTVYENDTGAVDADGVPAHSIAVVVEAGDINLIAAAIYSRKPPGIQTYGTTSVVQYDKFSLPSTINFFVATQVPIYFDITVTALAGWVASTADSIKAALAAFINELSIGEDVYVSQTQAIASFISSPLGQTFFISSFTLGTAPTPVGTTNIVILFNQLATGAVANINVSVV